MPDIHQQRGLDCIDCHTSNEAMGDGVAHARKSEQLRVACEDCHAAAGIDAADGARRPASTPSRGKILAVRAWPGPAAAAHGVARSGETLVNVVRAADGAVALVRKRTGERRELKPAAPVCVEGRRPRPPLLRQLPHRVGAALPDLPHLVRPGGRGLRLGGRRET